MRKSITIKEELKKAFNRVSRKELEWTMRKKGIPQDLVRLVMSLKLESKKRVNVHSVFSKKIDVKVRMHQASVLLPFLFAFVEDVVTVLTREGALSELLHADDLVLIN